MEHFIAGLPKLELYLHIEGTLEPELMFALGQRNGVALPWPDVDSLRPPMSSTACNPSSISTTRRQRAHPRTGFSDLTWAYLERCVADHVVHKDLFDP